MYPVLTKHFSELSTREYHRIVQAREAVFFLEQHITEPDADAIDPQSVFMWMEDGGRVVAFLRIIPAGIAYAEASVGRVLVDAAYRRRGLCRSLMSEALRYIARTWAPSPSASRHRSTWPDFTPPSGSHRSRTPISKQVSRTSKCSARSPAPG